MLLCRSGVISRKPTFLYNLLDYYRPTHNFITCANDPCHLTYIECRREEAYGPVRIHGKFGDTKNQLINAVSNYILDFIWGS